MAENETLDDLLEVWDDLIAEDPQADLDAFIREHGDKLDDDSTAKFRKKATALAAMNKRLDAFQDTASVPSDTSRLAQSHRVLADLKPGYEPIEGYKLVERLGKGGFGEVWKATDARGFSVAIKFVSLGGPLGEKESASLDVIKDVRHPHLLTIVGTRQIDNVLVIAMELADRTLLARFEEAQKEGCHGIPRDELLGYMAEAAEGIDFLNDPGTSGRHRIQHRDIKPQNLLLSGNSVKIADYVWRAVKSRPVIGSGWPKPRIVDRVFWRSRFALVSELPWKIGACKVASKRSCNFAPRLDRWEQHLPWALFQRILIAVRFKMPRPALDAVC